MSLAWATITRWVMCPLMSSPRMSWARALAVSGSSASLTPPAFPRPPTLTCALTTTGAAISRAIASACSGVSATPPGSTGTPCAANRSRAWYSKRSTSKHRNARGTALPHAPPDGWDVSHVSSGQQTQRPSSGVRDGTHVLAHPADDLLGAGARGEDLGDAQAGQLGPVGVGDDPAAEDDDVVDPALAQQLGQPGEQGHVRAGEHREPDGVGVLLDDGLHDLLRRLVQAGVDDLHAGVAQRTGHDLRATVVPVEAGLGDHHTDAFGCHAADSRGRRVAQVTPASACCPRPATARPAR